MNKSKKKSGGCIACAGAVATGVISAPVAIPIGIGVAATTYGVNKVLSKKSKSKTKSKKSKTKSKKSKQTGGRKKMSNYKKTKKKMKGGVLEAARYMVNRKPVKRSSSKKSSNKSSPKPVAKLFNKPEIKENYYKKAHKNRKTGNPVKHPGNRSLLGLDNQDILSLIGRETNSIRERKKLEGIQKTKRDYELDRQMSAEEKRWHTPSCTCDVDGPPGIGTCPECGAYNAY
tara:strand:+ start:14673 stop:15362 length:690 start_codon:yes stop_codon:yes gene_type:complete